MADREITWKLKIEIDKTSKSSVESFNKHIQDSTKATTDSMKRQHDDLDKRFSALLKKFEKDFASSVKAMEKAEKERIKTLEQLTAKQAAMTAQAVEGAKMALSGITQLGRSMILLGIATESDKKKMMELWATFESGVQLITGTINVVTGLTKAYQGLAAAKSAAAAISAAGGAVGVGGAAASAGGAVAAGGVGLTAGAGVAAAAGVLMAAKVLQEAFTGSYKEVDSFTSKIADAEVSVAQWAERMTGVDVGAGSKQKDAADKKQSAFNSMLDARDKEEERQRRLLGQDSQVRSSTLSSQEASLRQRGDLGGVKSMYESELDNARATDDGGTNAGREDKANREVAALNKIVEVRKQEREIIRDKEQLALDGIKKEVEAAEKLRDTYRTVAQDEEDRAKSAEEKFADLNAEEQARAARVAKDIRSGKEVSKDDRDFIGGTGILDLEQGALKNQLSAQQRSKAKGSKFYDDVFGGSNRVVDAAIEVGSDADDDAGKKSGRQKDYEQKVKRLEDEHKRQIDGLMEAVHEAINRATAASRDEFDRKNYKQVINARAGQAS